MTQIREYGLVLFSFLHSTQYRSVQGKSFQGFCRFLSVNMFFSFLFYGLWLYLTYGTKAVTSFDYVTWTLPFLFNVFLVTFAFCLTIIMGCFLVICWVVYHFNRNDMDLREFILASLYSTVIMSNVVVLFFAGFLYVVERLIT